MTPPRKHIYCLLVHLCVALVARAFVFADDDARQNVLSAFFSTFRIFQVAPDEGITTVSVPSDGYLTNGDTGEMVSTFIFMPPTGFSPEQYTITYVCDSDTVAPDGSCSITNAVASIVGTDATAYNTTVTCFFTSFPGTTQCNLYATLTAQTARQLRGTQDQTLVSRQSVDQYVSETLTVNVYGIVFYVPSGDGSTTASSIVSGSTSSYALASYDRTDQGVREIDMFMSIPGQSSSTGQSAVDFMATAAVTVTVGDYILNYDTGTCTLTGASFSNGAVVLNSPDSCAIGVAVESDTAYPTIGVQFRIYKSGTFTVQMTWSSFGTSTEAYEQVLIFDITEQAPPVITSVSKLSQYRSTPCDTETISLVAYNLRYADSRTIVVSSSDGTTSTWAESSSGLSYDSASDSSVISFDSAGGSGTDVTFTVVAVYGTTELNGIVLDTSISLTLSFSTAPVLSSMSPTTSAVAGGDTIQLSGSFDGFNEEGFVSVGGYAILATDLTVTDSTTISFTSPALSSLGQSYTYEVSVGICAETTSSITLNYEVSPVVTITSADSSTDDSGSYIVPTSGSASFVAGVSGNNDGIEYTWTLLASDGSQVSTGDTVTNLQIFELSSTLMSSSETYTVQCEVKNSLTLTDQAQVTAVLAAADTTYLLVDVYDSEDQTRSDSSDSTLVQSSVQVITTSASVSIQATSDVVLEWSYRGKKFSPDNSSAESSSTGVTQLGLEFNIARKDLKVGKEQLTLFAYLADNPLVNGSDTTTLNVLESSLHAVINSGVNGSLILEGSDLQLSGANSSDPDILQGEGVATDGITYLWFDCRKSLKSTFQFGVVDCTSILPSDKTPSEIIILASDLSDARMDTSTDPDPTFFIFGLRVTKESRTAEAYATFELRTLPAPEKIPSLSSLTVVDVKGVALDVTEVSIFSDVIIRPESSDPDVSWSFDMVQARQRYLFTKVGVLRTGEGFTSTRGEKSRSLLGFSGESLDPLTEYIVRVTATAIGTSLESDYEVSFTTADVPTMNCTPPLVTFGTTSETTFVISASLSFDTQDIDYCFYLVSSATRKYAVGKGCTSVAFARFAFPIPGTYGIECLAKTSSGAVVANKTLSTQIVLSTPTPAPSETLIQTLAAKLTTLKEEASYCEAIKDHNCIENLIASASIIVAEVTAAVESDSSEEALTLLEDCKAYYDQMSALSETLAKKTVYRPNQIEDSIDQTFYMSQVPPTFVEKRSTLFAFLSAADNAASSTSSSTSEAIISNEIVDKAAAIANSSLHTVFNLAQGGSSRTRLLRNVETAKNDIGAVLDLSVRMISQLRTQQETCGYSGVESTEHPESVDGSGQIATFNGENIPPLRIGLKVSCTQTQIEQRLSASRISLEVCKEVLDGAEIRRVVSKATSIPFISINASGFLTDVESYVDEVCLVEMEGLEGIPENCFNITMPRNQDKLTENDDDSLVGGVLTGLPSQWTSCTEDTCYIFDIETNSLNVVSFTDTEVLIQTNQTGMFIAGKYTGEVTGVSLEGKLIGANAQVIPTVGIAAAFIVVAILIVWVALSDTFTGATSTATSDEVAQGLAAYGLDGDQAMISRKVQTMNWEYVDRDFFARPRKKATETEVSIADLSMVIPDGASPPQIADGD